MTRPVVIVGAGIAGLATALALQQRGLGSVVLERRAGATDEGAGIQIGPNGVALLERLGLRSALEQVASVPDAIDVHDGPSGRRLTQLPLGAWIAKRHGHPYWVIHRADLMRVLSEAVTAAGIEVRYRCASEHVIDAAANDVRVALTSGETLQASAVIAADGLWSRVRTDHFDAMEPPPAERVAARAMLAADVVPEKLRGVVSVWMAPDAHLVMYPVARGTQHNVVVIARGETIPGAWSTALTADDVALRVQGFALAIQDMLRTARTWQQWPLISRTPLKTFAKGRIALIGDAAHPMMPYLAQGAVMALEDAVAIADALETRRDDRGAACAAFSQSRVARANRVVAAAARNGRIYHLSGPLALARNTTLRVAPPAMLMAGYDWIYGG